MQDGEGESEILCRIVLDGKIAGTKLALKGFRDAGIEDELPDDVEQRDEQKPCGFRRGCAILRSAAGERALQGEDVADSDADEDGNDQEEKEKEVGEGEHRGILSCFKLIRCEAVFGSQEEALRHAEHSKG